MERKFGFIIRDLILYRPRKYIRYKGKEMPNPLYKSFVYQQIKITQEEAKDWYLLGVELTPPRAGRIVGFRDNLDFILRPCGE